MDENLICRNSEACLDFINSRFDYYKQILDRDQQLSDQMIASIREQSCSYHESDEQFRFRTGFNRIDLANQLDYFEQEIYKTSEENKTCLFKMFQNLFLLHREFAFDEVLNQERKIEQIFQYRPRLISNIEKLGFNNRTKQEKQTFSNRLDIEQFQQKTSNVEIESNEIDLTKFIRETNPKNSSEQFKFSNLSKFSNQQKQSHLKTTKQFHPQTISCDNALLTAANKRFVLLYNMNTTKRFYIFDTENDHTKEFPWDEDTIYSIGHVDGSIFYLITATKIFLYDIFKEILIKEYFLYDSLYKDFLVIFDDQFYQTKLKRCNQLQSYVFDDYCYYLYTNKEYNQILIKCSIENFQQEMNLNLTKKYPQITTFLGLIINAKSLMTFLVFESNTYSLLFCNEIHDYNQLKTLSITNASDPTQILSTYQANIPVYPLSKAKNQTIKYGKQIWLILDRPLNCIHCLTNENYLRKIPSTKTLPIQSIALHEQKLLLAYNEFFVDILDLDDYFRSLKL